MILSATGGRKLLPFDDDNRVIPTKDYQDPPNDVANTARWNITNKLNARSELLPNAPAAFPQITLLQMAELKLFIAMFLTSLNSINTYAKSQAVARNDSTRNFRKEQR